MDPGEYPASGPPSNPPERLASGSRRVFHQSGSPMDPAKCPATARASRQWIPPNVALERLVSGSRRVSHQNSPLAAPASSSPVDPAEHATRAARQWIPLSISPSMPLSVPWRWIQPSIRQVSSWSGSPVFASGSCQYPRAARQSGFA